MPPQETLLHHGRLLLSRMRADRSAWAQLQPKVEKEAGELRDLRALDRQQLAWALQYEVGADDGELARALLEQEVAWREVAPDDRDGAALERMAWLVARDRRVEDVWLLARAKRASFEAERSFDLEHLVCAGVAATLEHVRASDRPERARVLELLLDKVGQPALEELAVLDWLTARARAYPRDPAEEPMAIWIERAIAVGERVVAKQLIAEWRGSCDRDADFLRTLAGYLAALQDHGEEADTRLLLLAHLVDPFERAGELSRVMGAERRAGYWMRAIEHLELAALLHRVRRPWRELGLGRELVREAFELVATSPEDIARRAFVIAEEFAAQTPGLPPGTLEHAIRAASRLGESERQRHYAAQLAATRAATT